MIDPKKIDTPDLAEALVNDPNGTFQEEVVTYLQDWHDRLDQVRREGLTPDDYDAVGRICNGINQATKLIEFFVKLKVLETGGTHETPHRY